MKGGRPRLLQASSPSRTRCCWPAHLVALSEASRAGPHQILSCPAVPALRMWVPARLDNGLPTASAKHLCVTLEMAIPSQIPEQAAPKAPSLLQGKERAPLALAQQGKTQAHLVKFAEILQAENFSQVCIFPAWKRESHLKMQKPIPPHFSAQAPPPTRLPGHHTARPTAI